MSALVAAGDGMASTSRSAEILGQSRRVADIQDRSNACAKFGATARNHGMASLNRSFPYAVVRLLLKKPVSEANLANFGLARMSISAARIAAAYRSPSLHQVVS